MPSRSSSSFWVNVGLLSGASLLALGIAIVVVIGDDWLRPPSAIDPTIMAMTGPMSTPFYMPGLQQPPTHPAASTSIADEAEVLGVSAGSKHRAYLVAALSSVSSHVVNDLLGDVAVTVTLCDRTQCARAFTAEGQSPLEVNLAGIFENKMLIKVGDVVYYQETGLRTTGSEGEPFPYPTYPCLRTTWKLWKEAHPETDVFLGIPVKDQEPSSSKTKLTDP